MSNKPCKLQPKYCDEIKHVSNSLLTQMRALGKKWQAENTSTKKRRNTKHRQTWTTPVIIIIVMVLRRGA